MYERVSQEGSGPGTFAFDFDHAPLQPLGITGPSQKLQREPSSEHLAPSISDLSVTDVSVQKPAINEKTMAKDDDYTHATLARSASHEWFSTVFDACLSLVPLFFLGTCPQLKVSDVDLTVDCSHRNSLLVSERPTEIFVWGER